MEARLINVTEEQFAKLVDAYKTIQDFLTSALSPNELYHEQFLAGLKESDDDIQQNNLKQVHSLDDLTS